MQTLRIMIYFVLKSVRVVKRLIQVSLLYHFEIMARDMRFPTMWSVRPARAQTSLRIQSDQSLCWSLEYSMNTKLLIKHPLEHLSLKGEVTGWSESTLVKMPHCWKSHVAAHIFYIMCFSSQRPKKEETCQ